MKNIVYEKNHCLFIFHYKLQRVKPEGRLAERGAKLPKLLRKKNIFLSLFCIKL